MLARTHLQGLYLLKNVYITNQNTRAIAIHVHLAPKTYSFFSV